jgi:transcriptional regulator with PAS, ATPase and Fis domain
MGRPLQAKLLRFLEDGSFTRVGGTEELRVDVRLIAATNRDIVKAIAAGEFREDLFHRLNVVQFVLPPLRERGDDIVLLGEHFLKIFRAVLNKNISGFSTAAQHKLQAHRWPGNVREMRNAIERALILETHREIQASSLPDFSVEARLQKGAPVSVAPDESLDLALERLERELIQNMLEQNNFNLTRVAERLRLSRHSLRYRMQRLNMKTAANDGGEPATVTD